MKGRSPRNDRDRSFRLKSHVSQGAIVIPQEIQSNCSRITLTYVDRYIEDVIVERSVPSSLRVAVFVMRKQGSPRERRGFDTKGHYL